MYRLQSSNRANIKIRDSTRDQGLTTGDPSPRVLTAGQHPAGQGNTSEQRAQPAGSAVAQSRAAGAAAPKSAEDTGTPSR